MRMGVRMNKASMAVRMRVHYFFLLHGVRTRWRGMHEPSYIPKAKNNQHDGHREFHAQADSNWNYKVKQNNSSSDNEDGESVADTPECSDERSPHGIALIAYDRGDGNNVVGVGSMAHPKEESNGENGEQSDHADSGSIALLQRAEFAQAPYNLKPTLTFLWYFPVSTGMQLAAHMARSIRPAPPPRNVAQIE
jgi:hypothetical protein